jgi:hypothetical protein
MCDCGIKVYTNETVSIIALSGCELHNYHMEVYSTNVLQIYTLRERCGCCVTEIIDCSTGTKNKAHVRCKMHVM